MELYVGKISKKTDEGQSKYIKITRTSRTTHMVVHLSDEYNGTHIQTYSDGQTDRHYRQTWWDIIRQTDNRQTTDRRICAGKSRFHLWAISKGILMFVANSEASYVLPDSGIADWLLKQLLTLAFCICLSAISCLQLLACLPTWKLPACLMTYKTVCLPTSPTHASQNQFACVYHVCMCLW